ncbi:DeoR/GlpR family DNA-binding transcription regulator [Acetobacteraceae bacterium KSS8]|uniref:DeoR/GlpR family DNA-binding transcription regulator n=1 Tax=Endosaccharibacter trunci TaxID=2812733 RepID=A0ABT1W3Q6_9PROT|nr:DeoR/GlpR family DNA-binding transcription regulator [Acetobacteraceae bacterium KSS8]
MVKQATAEPGAIPARRAARLERLRILAGRDGPVRLEDAARMLDVSAMTLRRDLAADGTGLSLFGGTIVAGERMRRGAYSLAGQRRSHHDAKLEAGRHAAALVRPGDTVFVDCGTTLPHLVASLPPELDVTIVCYALNIAAAAARLPRAQLFLLGGLFHPASATFLSETALRDLSRLGITRAFLSAGGLDPVQGVTCSNFNEVPVKRAVLDLAAEAVLVIDESKRGAVKPARFAPVDAFTAIVTERGISAPEMP